MFKLNVSYDCGIHYETVATSEDISDFKDQCKKFDDKFLRWVIESDDEEIVSFCRIHKGILSTLLELNTNNKSVKPTAIK